jgi:hypothetical protein
MTNQVPLSITARRPNLSNQIDVDDRWEPEEINDEFDLIEDIINNQMTQAMLDTESGQTVFGQKVFTSLFYSNNDTPSYDSIMNEIQNDISPITGTGAKAITSTNPKELGFVNQNTSGVIAKIASKNALFFKSNIYIEKNDSFIEIQAQNVPLAAYDVNKAGVPPTSNGNNYLSYYWPTSVSFSGILDLNDSTKVIGGLINNTRYEIYLAYRDDLNVVNCFIVRDGAEGNILNVFKSYRRIGFFRYKTGGNSDNFIISNGVFIPKHEWILPGGDLGNSNLASLSNVIGLAGYCKETCILELASETPTNNTTVNFNSNAICGLASTPNSRYLKGFYTFKFPMIYFNNQYIPASLSPSSDICRVKKIIFGGMY